jgi:hypothetical protein
MEKYNFVCIVTILIVICAQRANNDNLIQTFDYLRIKKFAHFLEELRKP